MSTSAREAGAPATSAVEASTIRKLRRRLLPFLLVAYVIAYLDRVNISYAKADMSDSISGFAAAYGFLAGIFFIGYFLFEVPSNVILQRVGARKWIARILITWGLVASLMAFAHSTLHVGLIRFALGAMEAGFFPGIVLYLTFWFPRRQLGQAFGMFMTAQVVSLIIGAPLSGVVLDHATWGGVSSWRWLFVIEGVPAVLYGIWTFFYLTDRPADATWLEPAERDWLVETIDRERREREREFQIPAWAALRNPRVLYLSVVYLFIVLGIYGVTFYLPAIVSALQSSYSHTLVGFISAIPFVIGGIAMVLNARHSDRTLERRYHVLVAMLFSAAGLILLANVRSPVLSVLALSITAIGAYGYIAPFWGLPTVFLTEASAAVGIAVINSVGNLGGFFGPYIVGLATGTSSTTKAQVGASSTALYLLAGSFVIAAIGLAFMRVYREERIAAPVAAL